MRRAKAILAPVVLVLALAGCGGGDEDDVKSTLRSYLDAFAKGDGSKSCDLMTTKTRAQFVDRVKVITDTSDCGKSIEAIRKQAGTTVMKALEETEISEVEVDGDRASAKLTNGANTSRAQLEKEDGEWRVAAVPGTQ
jgi:hypothetical protein